MRTSLTDVDHEGAVFDVFDEPLEEVVVRVVAAPLQEVLHLEELFH